MSTDTDTKFFSGADTDTDTWNSSTDTDTDTSYEYRHRHQKFFSLFSTTFALIFCASRKKIILCTFWTFFKPKIDVFSLFHTPTPNFFRAPTPTPEITADTDTDTSHGYRHRHRHRHLPQVPTPTPKPTPTLVSVSVVPWNKMCNASKHVLFYFGRNIGAQAWPLAQTFLDPCANGARSPTKKKPWPCLEELGKIPRPHWPKFPPPNRVEKIFDFFAKFWRNFPLN